MVRRIFSSSPQDPRYHMLSHISARFTQPSKWQIHEPRAALFLNRFTRTLTIMYATSGLRDVIGIPAETMRGRSFYYCIAENCLPDAVKCLENAKSNDSIAYLRFWFRDPRIDDEPLSSSDSDEEMTTTDANEDRDDGGVNLQDLKATSTPSDHSSHAAQSTSSMDLDSDDALLFSRDSSGDSTRPADTHEAIFGQSRRFDSSATSMSASPDGRSSSTSSTGTHVELEAVISCTSDGLVVCLRRARPMIPNPTQRPAKPMYANGLFAAPWAIEPTIPSIAARSGASPGHGSTFAPALGPHGARHKTPVNHSGSGPNDFMNAIRDQAIFAWALVGINGSLAEHSHGRAMGESIPPDGMPVWESDSGNSASHSGGGSSAGVTPYSG